ncbi:hypothetical protein B0H13DRAFT_2301297 [Mycena leptocephala]|nr:hypothetical protein B0H13DRAFT_2301297 [Mycena leptocephala]
MLYQRSVLLLLRLPEGMDQSYGFPVTLQNTEIFRSHLARLLSRAIGPVDTPETLGAPEKLDLTIVNRATSVILTALGPEDSDALLSEPLTPLEERYWTWESGTPPPGWMHRVNGNKMEKFYYIGSVAAVAILNIAPYAAGQFGYYNGTCWFSSPSPDVQFRWLLGSQSVWILLMSSGEVVSFLMHTPQLFSNHSTSSSGTIPKPPIVV